MKVGILVIGNGQSVSSIPSAVFDAVRVFELKGHEVAFVFAVSESDRLFDDDRYIKTGVDALLVTGDTGAFRLHLSKFYALQEGLNCFEIDNVIYLLSAVLTPEYVLKTAIPALNSKCKTFYNSVVIRTFGVTIPVLQERLSECVHNKNRIAFRFLELGNGKCEVRICFSKKTNDVNKMIARVVNMLQDCIYTVRDESLAEAVLSKLKESGKTLCTAESFTGGGIARALVSVAGASAVFKEAVITYSNESKQTRLRVDKAVLDRCGAVSVETAYEMAANALISSGCDYSVATTGNAGPAAERQGQAGLFFVAIGTASGVHIYKGTHKGDRESVIEIGINTALFRLYRNLCEHTENQKGEINRDGEEQKDG